MAKKTKSKAFTPEAYEAILEEFHQMHSMLRSAERMCKGRKSKDFDVIAVLHHGRQAAQKLLVSLERLGAVARAEATR